MTQKKKILALLKEAGGALVPTTNLNKIAWRYAARIGELQKDGHPIPPAEHMVGTIWGYRLKPKQGELP